VTEPTILVHPGSVSVGYAVSGSDLAAYEILAGGWPEKLSSVRLGGPTCVSVSVDPSGRFLYTSASCVQSEVLHGTQWGDPSQLSMIEIDRSEQRLLPPSHPPRVVEFGAQALAPVLPR
jgi:hypothetical protein